MDFNLDIFQRINQKDIDIAHNMALTGFCPEDIKCFKCVFHESNLTKLDCYDLMKFRSPDGVVRMANRFLKLCKKLPDVEELFKDE